jgi:hypothetical protein
MDDGDICHLLLILQLLGIEPRASHILGKCSNTVLRPQPFCLYIVFWFFFFFLRQCLTTTFDQLTLSLCFSYLYLTWDYRYLPPHLACYLPLLRRCQEANLMTPLLFLSSSNVFFQGRRPTKITSFHLRSSVLIKIQPSQPNRKWKALMSHTSPQI